MHDVMDVGTTLQRARKRKGLTLEQVAHSTKISINLLHALEDNDIEKLPASFYTRGFLRTYAREVDLDPEEMVQAYLEQFEPEPEEIEDVPAPAPAPLALTLPNLRVRLPFKPHLRAVAAAVGSVLIAFAAYAAWPRGGAPAEVAAQAAPAADVARASAPATPDVTQAALNRSAGEGMVVGEIFRLDLSPQAPCWVSATADGKPAVSRLMQPGEKETIQIRGEVVLRVGDPAACSYSIEGVSGRALGDAGKPVTVKITRDNFREFLAPRQVGG